MSESDTRTPQFSQTTSDNVVNDIFLWRNKKVSATVLVISTVIWVVLEVYQFNFITVASWVFLAIVGSVFLWANLLRLLGKDPPNMTELEVREHSAMEMAKSVGGGIEEGVRWMFRVGAEREWYVFAGTVAALWLLSVVGNYFDLLTLLYIGIVMGMTVPMTKMKYEDQIKRYLEGMKTQGRRLCDMVDEKVLTKIKSIISKKVVKEKREKKVE